MRKKRITVIILAVMILAFIAINWIPGKYAVKEEDFKKYEPYILVQEVHYTGTGWVQVGDEGGYFLPEAYIDIGLVNGIILPQMDLYNEDYVNTFLCKVESRGKKKHPAFEDEIETYYIVEWYPVYPVLRDTILPGWLYPKNFMTKFEIGRVDGQELDKMVIGRVDGQESDKMVIRVDGWDMEYTVSDRKLTVEDFECIELGSSLNEIESKLGEPDGWVGSGILSPVYVLEDNSAVELIFANDATDEDLSAIYLYKEQKGSVLKKR